MRSTDLLEEMFLSKSREGKDGLVGFAKFLMTYPIQNDTAPVYVKVLRTGIKEVADILFAEKDPETFFSAVTPSTPLCDSLLESLIELSPGNSDPRIVICFLSFYLLWISSRSFLQAGAKIEVQGIYHLAKFFLHDDTRVKEITERLLEEISEKTYRVFPDACRVSLMILDASRDKKKNLKNILPNYLWAPLKNPD